MKEEFLNAVTQGDVARVKEFLKTDPALARETDSKGISAILKAAYYRKKDIVAVLLSQGLELNIFEASATGRTARVETVLAQDSTLANAYAVDGFTPLGLAVFFGHQKTVEALVAAGADVNTPSRESMKVTPLHSAATARNVDIARLLLIRGANVNVRQADSGLTPLHEAAANGDLGFAKLLLDYGAEIDVKMSDGKSPLALALDRQRTAMVEFLRKRGAVQ